MSKIKDTVKATMSDFLDEVRGMITGEYDPGMDVPFDVPTETRSLMAW
ncbi:unnamed protein product, partial [marine sediment metagenome]